MTQGNEPVTPHLTYNVSSGQPNGLKEGLTKREYFAAMAMQGMCANQPFLNNLNAEPSQVAAACIEIADALINALNQPNE